MPNERIHLTFITPPDEFKVCIQYVFDLFGKTYNYTVGIAAPSDPKPTSGVCIYYGDEIGISDGPLPAVLIKRSSFFSSSFGKSVEPPTGFSELVHASGGTGFGSLSQRDGQQVTLQYDVVAAAFYMLSGYFEYISTERDQSGRLLSTHVPIPAETWETPVVSHWMRQLDELIRSLMTGADGIVDNRPAVPEMHTVCLTHDVDLMQKYRMSSLPRHLVRAGKSGNFSAELGRARKVLSGKQRDPFDSFDQLYTVKERISAPSTFFFLASEPGARNGDYRVTDRNARNLIIRAKSFEDEIGLHGSWESADIPSKLREEKTTIESVAGSGSVKGSRQHYLRFNNPKSWAGLAEAGLRYDSTGGFPNRCGFKYGWSGCFHPFDLTAMVTSPVIEIPLICMDVTLAAYEKIPSELALERMTNLLDAACERVQGGAFVFLWHNTMGDKATYPGYWDTFEYFFSVASGSARFLTLSQLCDEFEARA